LQFSEQSRKWVKKLTELSEKGLYKGLLVSNDVDTNGWDEAGLVSSLKERQEEAFRILVRQYQGRLFSIAYGITLDREESLDIVQEVFLRVFKKIHTFREDSRLSTWLHRITVNLCLNLKRRWRRRFNWRHQTIEGSETADHLEPGTDDYYPEALYQRKELEGILWKTLRELPEQARAAFVLKELEGLSYDEIAKTLKIKKGTVSSRLFYARKRLRKLLEPYLSDS